MGVTIYEQAGTTRFIDQHTVETERYCGSERIR
jgi:hypothetical protein